MTWISKLYIMRNLCFFILTFIVFNLLYFTNGCVFTRGYNIHMITEITYDNVEVHCKSKDDDLGVHVLNFSNLEYGWSFCENVFYSTLYYCHFSRLMTEQTFDVFNRTMFIACYQGYSDGNTCHWGIKKDGFYFFDLHNQVWVKQYDWKYKGSSSEKLIHK